MFYECRVTNANEQLYSETARRVISPYISRQHTQRGTVGRCRFRDQILVNLSTPMTTS